MAFHIQRPSVVDETKLVYYAKKYHWSDDYSDRKTWATRTSIVEE